MKWRTRRLAGRLGLDRNPLRRRCDRVASLVTAGLLAVFLAGAPVVSLIAWHWCARASVTEQRHQQAWHQVQAVVTQSVPAADEYYCYGGGSWGWGRWTAPAGCVAQVGPERRRLTEWEAAWTWIGPQWTREFWAHG